MKPSTQDRSDDPSLTEAARHLVLPAGIVSTGWPAVLAICLTLQLMFDRWQDGLGRALLGKGKDGLYAADYAVISIPRQVGKTYLLGAIVMALCIATPKTLVLWTAHRSATAQDTFRDLKALAQLPTLKHHIAGVYDSGDRREVVFTNGSRIAFGARERGFGRGFKKVAILIFDEAQILTDKGLDDMVPTTNRHPNPLIILAGTPPKPTDPGEAFTRLRAEALSGESDSVLYVEMSADEDADPRDRGQWKIANPSHPKHTPVRAMLRMLKLLGVESFLREGLGIWDGSATIGVLPAGSWGMLANEKRKPPKKPAALGIASDLDQVWLSLSAVGGGKRRHVGPLMRVRVDKGRADFVAEVARLQDKYGCPVAIDARGPAAFLVPDLEEAGVNLDRGNLDDFVQACADFLKAVSAGALWHGNYEELNDAIDAAGWRMTGDRRVFARKAGDISMLEAAAWALWIAQLNDYDVADSFL